MDRRQHFIAAALILLVGIASYFDSLSHPYMVDDHSCFETNDRNLSSLPHRFFSDKQDVYYRPFAYSIPAFSYFIFGDHVVGHHSLNLFLFCAACFLLYLLVAQVFENWTLGLLTALFYIVHPINGVVVNYITASVFAAEVIFMLASLSFVIASERSERRSSSRTLAAARNPVFKRLLRRFASRNDVISIFFFILALMCHETAAVLPFYAAALLVFGSGYKLKDALRRTLPLWVVLGIFIWFHWSHASIDQNLFQKISSFQMNVWEYAATLVKLLWWYLSRLVYPNGIVLIWTTAVVRQGIGWWLLLFIVLIGAFIFLMRHFKNDNVIRLGLVWLALGFLPMPLGSLFQPAHGMMVEPHWFIFSGIGFFLIIARIMSVSLPFVGYAIMAVMVLWMSLTHIYNSLWGNEKRYCFYWLKEAPNYSAALFFLGEVYKHDHEYGVARYFFNKALYREYDQWIIYMNLGEMDLAEQKWDQARRDYLASLPMNPNASMAYNNLGLLAQKEKDEKNAREYYHQAINADSNSTLARLNIAQLQLKNGDTNAAINTYKEILRIDPHDEMPMISLLKVYVDQKDEANALGVIDHLLTSHSAQTLTNCGILLAFYKKYDKAIESFERSIQLDASYTPAYAQETQLLAQLGEFDRAFAVCQKGLTINPQDETLNNLMNRLKSMQS